MFVEGARPGPGGGGPPARIRLTRGAADALSSRVGGAVLMGIRPQHLKETIGGAGAPGAMGGDSMLGLHVGVVEPLGDTMDLHGTTAAGAALQ